MRAACPFLTMLLIASAATAPGQSAPDPPAASPPAASEAPRPPVFYETATVTAREVSSASAAVSVLDGGEIEAAAARSAAEILREVPGLVALSSGGRAGVTNAYLRGSDPNYTLVLLDGIPLNDATELQGGAVNLEELPAGLLERAEVVRGPLTSFYGTNALAGVIQLFTARGGGGPLGAAAGVEGGNADLRRAFGRVTGTAGRAGYAAGAAWDREAHRIGADRFRQLDLWGSADLPLGANASLALSGRFADGATQDYPDASGGPVYGSGLLRHTDHESLALGARLDFGDPAGRRQRLFVGLARRDQSRTSPAVAPVVPESQEQTTFSRLRAGWQLPLLRRGRTQVDVGLSGEGEWGDNASTLKLPAELGGNVPGDYARARVAGGGFAGVRHQRGALLYEGALRLDAATGGTVQANPHAGVAWHPGRATRLRASAGRASKLPSFFALASPPALGGNPSLAPEHVWGGEVGLEQDLRGARAVVGATYFRQEYGNLVDFDFDRFLHVNRAHVRTQGLELIGRWQAHPTLALEGELTRLAVVDLEGGGPLLHEPRWTGGGRLTWRPLPQAGLRLQARGSSGTLDRQYPVPDRDAVAAYRLLGAAAWWRLRNGLVLRARADNLTDRRYETLIGFPGPGRSFWAGVGWERPSPASDSARGSSGSGTR